MKSLLITVPILPGKVDLWRRLVSASVGERREAYRRAIREGGLTRLRVWHEHGPDGSDVAVVLYEGATPERFLERIATGRRVLGVVPERARGGSWARRFATAAAAAGARRGRGRVVRG